MYVNRAVGIGIGVPVTSADFDMIEAYSERTGVLAEVEVCPWAHPSLLQEAASRGYVPAWFRSVLVRRLDVDEPASVVNWIEIELVGPDLFATFQEVSSRGFGDTTAEQHHISVRFWNAVLRIDGTSLFLARIDREAVGVASLTIRDGVATLGGMSTVPSARRQGVQSDLIRHRLAVAAGAGCDLALTTAAPGSVSERNLFRAGFSLAYTQLAIRKPMIGSAGVAS
jgi:GNAT superfamily N-acetyltransferase